MNDSTKEIFRKLTPPILLPLGKSLLRSWERPSKADAQHRERIRLLRAEHDRRNATAAEDEIVLRDDLTLKIHPESRWAFEHFCFLEPVVAEELNCFIENTRDKTTLLDIGALHGIFSLVFAATRRSNKALAVDPSPVAFAPLLYNIHKNGFANIIPVECALSDTDGILRMHYEWGHAVAAANHDLAQTRLLAIKRTADELCESLCFVPDVVKIDVEGHEVKVLKGMSRLIECHRPLVFLEVHPRLIAQENDHIADVQQVFSSNRYQAFLVGSGEIAIQDIAKLTDVQRLMLTPS